MLAPRPLTADVRPAAPAAGRTSPAACGRLFGHLAAAEQAAGADGPIGKHACRWARGSAAGLVMRTRMHGTANTDNQHSR